MHAERAICWSTFKVLYYPSGKILRFKQNYIWDLPSLQTKIVVEQPLLIQTLVEFGSVYVVLDRESHKVWEMS